MKFSLRNTLMAAMAGAASTKKTEPEELDMSSAGIKNYALDPDALAIDQVKLPQGCGDLFVDYNAFVNFYDAAISVLAAKRGPTAKGVADLFAVSEIRSEMNSLFPNMSSESPIDQIIEAQICQYEKIWMNKEGAAGGFKKVERPSSSNEALQDHLISIADKLYRDSRKVLVDSLAARARQKQKADFLASKWLDVLRAREAGRAKLGDVLKNAGE